MAADFECPWPDCLYSVLDAGKPVACQMAKAGFGCIIKHTEKVTGKAPVIVNIPVNVMIKIEPGTRVCDQDLVMIQESARDGVVAGLGEMMRGDL